MRLLARLPAAVAACLALANCAPAGETLAQALPEAPPSRAAAAPADDAVRAVPEADLACLAEAVYFEAGGSPDGFRAVAHVVVNRARDPRFPRTVCGVVADRCQFSYRCDGNSLALRDAGRRDRAQRTAEAVLTGAAPDPTRGALFFHSARVSPSWFRTRPRVGEIGGNVFYR